MYLRKRWNDPRIKYVDGPDHVNLTPDVAKKMIWIPDLFISNSHETQLTETVKPDFGVRVNANGDVLCSIR